MKAFDKIFIWKIRKSSMNTFSLSSLRFMIATKKVHECTITCKINGTAQRCLLAHFETKLDFSRSKFTRTY